PRSRRHRGPQRLRPDRPADRSPGRPLPPRSPLPPSQATAPSSASTFYRTIVRYHAHMPRRTQAAVAETRTAVTHAAVDRASVEGLEGLTLGGLAGEMEMRKSSVFSLFGSKRDLQLATLEAAVDQFTEEVWGPVADEPAGLARLIALCDSWLSYHQREVLPGGCFLTTV